MRVRVSSLSPFYYRLEAVSFGLVIASSMGLLSFLFQEIFHIGTNGNILYYASWFILYVVSFAFVFYRRSVNAYLSGTGLIFLFLVFVVASSFWSVDFSKSIISSISLVLTALFGISMSRTICLGKLNQLLSNVFSLCVYITVVLLVVYPSSLYSDLGFSSIFLHKNHSGFYYSIFSVFYIYNMLFKTDLYLKSRMATTLCLLLSMSFMVYSNSALGFVSFLSGLFVVISTRLNLVKMEAQPPVLIAVFGIVYFLVLDILLPILGKDFTFTGRTTIWKAAWPILSESKYLGFGYSGFFTDSPNSPSLEFYSRFEYYFAPTLHNGYLEVLSQLGFVGLAFVALIVFRSFRNLFRLRENSMGYSIAPFLAMLSMFLVENIGESVLFNYNHFISIIFIYFLTLNPKKVSR